MFCAMHGTFEQMKVAKQWELREAQNLKPVITQGLVQGEQGSQAEATTVGKRGTR